MNSELNRNGKIDEGAHLLMAILVRYPEIGTIHFESNFNSIKLTFMLTKGLSSDDVDTLKSKLMESVFAMHALERVKHAMIDISHVVYEKVTFLSVVRDIKTFTLHEVALLVALLRQNCRDFLISDWNDSVEDEESDEQEELIENMLESVKTQQIVRNLIGIREDGRVLVFNR